ncbi:phosphate regulon sensor histidine kinase PhoR [Parazoarcus communis]|uniref:phosphate regulon sensor histidine kinase PhoR n=1 Tax=Parazoarcus communis TaxID=41977 RepID=UPI001900792F|nr:phosphate regulon sensor histidine kinase PhoR [Parazoarcus communis]
MRYLWTGVLSALCLLALVSAAVALFAGVTWGLTAFIVGVLLLLGWHVHNLIRLVMWSREPIGTPVPRAAGSWGQVFAELNRRSRVSYDMRERLSSALERFHDASQAMPDGVLYLSDSDTIEWINLKAEQHFGLDHTRDIGAPVTNLVRQPEFVHYLQAGKHDEPLIMTSGRRSGLTLQVQIIPFGDDQQMVLSRDISQLERLETMRRDFVANVSHELRTPLTVIGGFLETLVDGLDDYEREDVMRFLRLALDQSSRMGRLIDDLLTLSALETGAPAPAEERIDVAALMQEIHEDTELLSAGRHTVTLQMEGDGVLLGSGKEIHSAFSNLASNAVRYTPEGGKIDLVWRVDAQGAEFSVRDTGIGVDPIHIPRLTERFYRVDRGRSRETGGTGLGLAIVKHILTRHQADLRVSSKQGEGSVFSVRLPPARLMALPAR